MSTPEGADTGLPRYPGPVAPRTGGAAVVVRGLRKKFGVKEAVAGIDLQVAAGSLAGLVGPNGAGKTTSLSMMTGLLRPVPGSGAARCPRRPVCSSVASVSVSPTRATFVAPRSPAPKK